MAHYICLAEDLSSIPRIHIGRLTAPSTSGSWRYSALLRSPWALHRHTGTDRLLKKKIDVRNNKGYSNLIGMHLRFSQDCLSFGHRVETQSSSISRLPYPVYDPHPKLLIALDSRELWPMLSSSWTWKGSASPPVSSLWGVPLGVPFGLLFMVQTFSHMAIPINKGD